MAERKSVNKYYPPDWDPSKGSVNKYVGQHPLRDRAKKLGQGILVIRFEMPYNIWCGGCNAHIGMGVRYNAEKTKTGNYYTTPIYKFRMKCHLCDNYFEIQTDPKNHDYVILEGARRKEQRWDPKENEQIVPEDKATQKKLATDAMFKLEHGTDDRQRGKKAVSNLSLLESSKEGMKDDYILNKMARNKFREEKKALRKVQEDDSALLKKSSLEIPLLKEKEEDIKLAGLIRLRALETYDEKQIQKRKQIESRPIFSSKKQSVNENTEEPSIKKLKIIKDNIMKAKANYSKSPFDRMKTNTLGDGLTKDQLGIRKKRQKSVNDGNYIEEKAETIEKDIIIVHKAEVKKGDNNLKEDMQSMTFLVESESNRNTERENAESCCGDPKLDQNKDEERTCITETHKHSELEKHENEDTEKTDTSVRYYAKVTSPDVKQMNINVHAQESKSGSNSFISLVAAYSDSEDTDTSTG